jgi:bilirubin oxidase
VALKDVVWLNTNEQVNVIARYAPWDGFYMFHCHNLIHEDHEMMAAFNVTALTDLGYDEKTSFIDPMEARYRSKHFSDSDLTSRSGDFADSAIQAKVGFFVSFTPPYESNSREFAKEIRQEPLTSSCYHIC